MYSLVPGAFVSNTRIYRKGKRERSSVIENGRSHNARLGITNKKFRNGIELPPIRQSHLCGMNQILFWSKPFCIYTIVQFDNRRARQIP